MRGRRRADRAGTVAPLVTWALIAAAFAGCAEPPEGQKPASVGPAVAWAADGGPPSPGGDTLCADTAASMVRWRGTEVAGDGHAGVVRLAGGHLVVEGDAVTGGEIVVDMRTIGVTDIPPHEVEARRQLRSHLAHEEFFAVDRFPTARLVLTGVEPVERGVYRVTGNLAIRDSVHSVTFEAAAPAVSPDGAWASAGFSFDRQLWGVRFDGRISSLRDAIVHDPIHLQLHLVATPEACRRG